MISPVPSDGERVHINVKALRYFLISLPGAALADMHGYLLACILAVATVLGCSAINPACAREIIIYFSDFGINQKYDHDKGGAAVREGFGQLGEEGFGFSAKYRADVLGDSGPDVGRILVQMPTDAELKSFSNEELKKRWAKDIESQVHALLDRGVSKFDVQFVQNITFREYSRGKPDPNHVGGQINRQDLIDRFGSIGYGALADVVTHLSKNDNVTLFGAVMSNGTSMFTRAVAAWRSISSKIAIVSMVSGRAVERDIEAILTPDGIAASKLRLILNHFDFWAPGDSIARLSVALKIKSRHPEVTVLLATKLKLEWVPLAPAGGVFWPMNHHGALMADSRTLFFLEEKNAGGRTISTHTGRRSDIFFLPTATEAPAKPDNGSQKSQKMSGAGSARPPEQPSESNSCDPNTTRTCAPPAPPRHNNPIPPGGPPPPPPPPIAGTPGERGRPEVSPFPAQPGGIDLRSPAALAKLRLPPIEAVVLDVATNSVVLVGRSKLSVGSIQASDLAMALWLVYGPNPQDPQFSLDPADPANPKGSRIKAVYRPEAMIGRSAGATLFSGDLLLKELGFGVRHSGEYKIETWKPNVPGFKSYADLVMETEGSKQNQERWARFWIVVSQIIAKSDGTAVVFEPRMAVKARRQVPDRTSTTGLRDIETAADTLEARWSALATTYFEDLSRELPELSRVKQFAAAMACAKWLKEQGAKIDLEQVVRIINADETQTVATMDALSIQWEKENLTPYRAGNREVIRVEKRRLHLSGGIDMAVMPAYVHGNGIAHALGKEAISALRTVGPEQHVTTFEFHDQRMQAVTLPLLRRAEP